MRIVMKFGGVSMGDGMSITYSANLVKKYLIEGNMIVVVVSAMAGVTDSLLKATEAASKGNQQRIETFIQELSIKHKEAAVASITQRTHLEQTQKRIDELLVELRRILIGISYLAESSPRSKDLVLSFGEKLSTTVICGALEGFDVKVLMLTGGEAGIVTDDHFGEAHPLLSITRQRVRERLIPLLNKGVTPVVTGFIANSQTGIVTTLGRGSSDYTATLLGAAVGVDEVWVWKDVEGVMTTDPKIVPSARTLPLLSFSEAMEMAYFGAKVIHPKAVVPLEEQDIPLRIKNVFNPANPGTLIVKKTQPDQRTVRAVTMIKDVALITVGGGNMIETTELVSRVFQILSTNNIPLLMISQSSSKANVSFIIPLSRLDRATDKLRSTLLEDRKLIQEILWETDVCLISTVGSGMRGKPGVAARVFKVVADQGSNIRIIAQGSSEFNISFVVKEKDAVNVIKALHKEFKLYL